MRNGISGIKEKLLTKYLVKDTTLTSVKSTNINIAELCKKRLDLFYDKHTKIRFHPGVTLAVYNSFGDLDEINGLFCVQKSNNRYTDFSVSL